ncbi:MAG: hypothetical protein ACK54F_07290 [Planctomycetia bacterium]
MILVQQRYESPNAERQAELDRCREINGGLDAFAHVDLVDGAAKRWTFGDFFRLTAERYPGEICVVANSDIAFDASIALAGPLAEQGALVALSRWDDPSAPSMEGRVAGEQWHFFSHSQDVWVFKAGSVPTFPADIQLGIPQCESRLAYEAAAAGVIVVNPALSIRSFHHHASAVRSWRRKDGYRGPILFPRLTTVEAIEPEALVVERLGRFRKREAVVRLSGRPGALATALAKHAAERQKKSLKIGLRSPFYLRERQP